MTIVLTSFEHKKITFWISERPNGPNDPKIHLKKRGPNPAFKGGVNTFVNKNGF